MSERRCDRCEFFKADPLAISHVSHGECRRGPPIAGNVWPRMAADDWCGEFERMSALSAHIATADAADKSQVYTCLIICEACNAECKVEHTAAFGLLGFHCRCGHYTKAAP